MSLFLPICDSMQLSNSVWIRWTWFDWISNCNKCAVEISTFGQRRHSVLLSSNFVSKGFYNYCKRFKQNFVDIHIAVVDDGIVDVLSVIVDNNKDSSFKKHLLLFTHCRQFKLSTCAKRILSTSTVTTYARGCVDSYCTKARSAFFYA